MTVNAIVHDDATGHEISEPMDMREIISHLRSGRRVTVLKQMHGFDTRGHYCLVYITTAHDAIPQIYPPHSHVPEIVARRAEAVVLLTAQGFLYIVREPTVK